MPANSKLDLTPKSGTEEQPEWYTMPRRPTTAMLVDAALAYERFIIRQGGIGGKVDPHLGVEAMKCAYAELLKYSHGPDDM